MEFHIGRDTFLYGIQKTLGIVERKTTIPILNNILLRTEDDRIKIVATDKEIGLISRYDAKVSVPGDITLSAKKLYEMVREIQGETVHFVKNDQHQVTMTSGKAIYRIPGLPADEYPQVVEVENVPLYRISGPMLAELIRKIVFAVSTDEIRVHLNGAFLETEGAGQDARLKMVATDGHRLAVALGPVGSSGGMELEKGVIIPRKGLGEIRKIAAEEQEVEIGCDHGMFIMKTKNLTIKVSLIDAEYPDYRRVIPTEKGASLHFGRDKVLHALRRMSVISNDRYNGVIVTLGKDLMVLNSNNPDVGEANDEIEVSYAGEEEVGVSYNVNYLIDAIEVIDEEEVSMEINVGMKPGVIRGLGNDNYLCIVMPLKL
ncbi:MAG: DNA polymerase III subunit beta [Syntrophobacterales bacterium]|nr:DNA polymerase III subunit beta [Syntrophobacterales bacterium]